MSKQGSNSCRFTKIILPTELSAEPAVLTACLKIQQAIRPPEGAAGPASGQAGYRGSPWSTRQEKKKPEAVRYETGFGPRDDFWHQQDQDTR